MSGSQGAENDAPYEVTRAAGLITVACACGDGRSVIDKGLGRATIAAWKTQHQDCARVTPPASTEALS